MEEIKAKEFDEWDNPDLREPVERENELKTWLVEYVGNKHNPEDGSVTVQMIVDTLAEDFPEFTLAVAGENFLRGYHQALCDLEIEKSEDKHNKT
jgi:hypothetical protein